MRSGPLFSIGFAALLFTSVTLAQSQDTPGAEQTMSAEDMKVEEVVVVTASRTEQLVHDVPAAITVLTAEDIADIPADDYGDLLRNVPGLNVSQMSARDIQISGRSATGSLSTHQLVLLDNRTLYLDFFGFVMWDFLPINPTEIRQIEVVRGPGSAVWGANAMSGVINLITKRPKEMEGTSILAGGGEIGTLYGSLTHADARDRWGYKISAGYFEQDPYDRPTGLIPGTTTRYPAFTNEGTEQPKLDLRLDYDISDASTVTLSGGYAGTDGLVHSGIGPFDIDRGASLSYGKIDWNRRALRVSAFANFLNADSNALLAIGVNGRPLPFSFDTRTYNLDVSNTTVLAQKNIMTYGANARTNSFELSIAPGGEQRDEYGIFLQDEILIGDRVRWTIGSRFDNIDPIGSVISPRTALLFSPVPNQTFRISYNRAYRAPSMINNYLNTTILNLITLPTGPYVFPTRAVGNPELQEEKLDAYEIGYVGSIDVRTIFTVSLYRNETEGEADFYPASFYTPNQPPPGFPLPPAFLGGPPLNALPSSFSYRNVGRAINQGVELSLNRRSSNQWSWFANYSWQDDPEVDGSAAGQVNIPPTHRANLGASWDPGRFFVNGNANYQDEAFWTDVLDARFWGPTDAFTQVNLSVGARFANDRATFSIIGSNIFDERIQQHVFGDIIGRKVTAQLMFQF